MSRYHRNGQTLSNIIRSLWNYNPENNDAKGDHWNGENFSWFNGVRALPSSLLYHEQTAVSLDQGGRILPAVIRPYPAKTAGIPSAFKYEMNTGTFTYSWTSFGDANQSDKRSSPSLSDQTEIFVPHLITQNRKVIVQGLTDRDAYLYDINRQTLYIIPNNRSPNVTYSITVSLDPPLEPSFHVNGFLDDFSGYFVSIGVVVFAVALYFILLQGGFW